MNSTLEIKELATARLEDAKILLANSRYEGAFYLAGYAIELTLKAKICTHLDIDDLFSDNPTTHSKGSLGRFRESLMTHDLFILLNLCGLGQKFEKMKLSDVDFSNNCSLLFQNPTSTGWSEKVRYKQGYITSKTVDKIINFLTEPTKGLLQWIENN